MTTEEIADIALKTSNGEILDKKTATSLCCEIIMLRQQLKRIRREISKLAEGN